MPSDELDDQRLLRTELDELYDKALDELSGENCRDLLAELFLEEWQRLTTRSSARDNRKQPNTTDAANAFQAIKHSLIEDSRRREELLPDPSRIHYLTPPELWTYLKKVQLRYWFALISLVSSLVIFAFLAGWKFAGLFLN